MPKPGRTPSEKLALIRAWRASGLTADEFAAQHGTSGAQLRGWAWKLGKPRPRRNEVPPIKLVELPAVTDHRVELAYPDGRVLRVPSTISPAVLDAFLRAMESRK